MDDYSDFTYQMVIRQLGLLAVPFDEGTARDIVLDELSRLTQMSSLWRYDLESTDNALQLAEWGRR